VQPHPYASLILMIAIVAVIGYDSLQDDAKTEGARAGASGMARVERAVDGDTVILSEGLGSSRIVGVDTPEAVKPDTSVQCFGPKASAFTKQVPGATVPRRLPPFLDLRSALWRDLYVASGPSSSGP
jgi:hypothetical protein